MLDVYRVVAGRVGSPDAEELADELSRWHKAMVLHERLATDCDEDEECPHSEARELWNEARRIFGEEAENLVFLKNSASAVKTEEAR
ncbi:MAG: hypothetical protein DIU54_002105 [Acidobacteriota bacterium]|jgi:hypothetical protein|nr:MAG: hypothetical protein DIU54_06310 [Acidobacteriota bacterium]